MENFENLKINEVNLSMGDQVKYTQENYTSKLEKMFKEKAEKLKNTKLKLDNDNKLKFYGLYKVSTEGQITEKNKKDVGFFDFEGKYKKY